ncbi:MAG TPA: phosphoribosylanthranilate isomerase [Opitutaceae bacterium]|nr:phosphoribosylanthranilate isomerase [Opitutaceae bacterium]
MINKITLKVCGITSAEDAHAAVAAGADHLGFIFHPASPRALSAERFAALRPALPAAKRVAVVVNPAPAQLAAVAGLGFDAFQVHFKADEPMHRIAAWAEAVGAARLWLAPKLPPEADVAGELLGVAETFLLDAYHPEKYGGTGETGDWAKFKRHQEAHPGPTWILSGGLNPENVHAAIAASGARFIDVNSGVESAPGKKDRTKLRALALALGA